MAKHFGEREISFQPIAYSGVRYSCFSDPLFQCLGFSEVGNVSGSSPVASLCGITSPATVTRRIVPVIVDAFDAVLRGRLVTHIVNKVFVSAPPVANRNTAPAVTMVVAGGFSTTPITHSRPRGILCGSAFPMRCVTFFSNRLYKTPARFCSIPAKCGAKNNTFPAAVAKTMPSRVPTFTVGGSGYDCEAGEYLASKVDKFRHAIFSILNINHKNKAEASYGAGFRSLNLSAGEIIA